MGLKRKNKYRVVIYGSTLERKIYWMQEKSSIFGGWKYMPTWRCMRDTLKEIMALKVLLENGHSEYDIFLPSARCEMLNLSIE